MTALHDLAADADAANRANNFEVPTWDNLPGKLAFLFTESIEEAHEEQANGPEAVHVEIADAAIRIMSTLNAVWGDAWADRIQFRHVYCRTAYDRLETMLLPANIQVCKALQAWRKDDRHGAREALEVAVLELYRVSDRMGFDLSAEIARKVEINRGRGALHGKKRSLG
jgi:hypothetical protein